MPNSTPYLASALGEPLVAAVVLGGHVREHVLRVEVGLVVLVEGVRVREDADLAEMLAAADIDTEIPVEAFIAVAEILRYVYAANDIKPQEVSKS